MIDGTDLRRSPLLCLLINTKSWINCALRDDEAVYWVSIGHYEAVAVGNWWYWVSTGHSCLYILHKVEIWTGVTDAWQTDWLTDSQCKDRATQLLTKYKSGALVTQFPPVCSAQRVLAPCEGRSCLCSGSRRCHEGGQNIFIVKHTIVMYRKFANS